MPERPSDDNRAIWRTPPTEREIARRWIAACREILKAAKQRG